jgi:hydroxymethylglutaryl-CoA lyase
LPAPCPPRIKRSGCSAAYEAGLREIEVGSFVPARLLPQLADTAELVALRAGRCRA